MFLRIRIIALVLNDIGEGRYFEYFCQILLNIFLKFYYLIRFFYGGLGLIFFFIINNQDINCVILDDREKYRYIGYIKYKIIILVIKIIKYKKY